MDWGSLLGTVVTTAGSTLSNIYGKNPQGGYYIQQGGQMYPQYVYNPYQNQNDSSKIVLYSVCGLVLLGFLFLVFKK